MKTVFTFLLTLAFTVPAFAGLQLTKDQYANLGILHQELQKKYPQFQGFNGEKDNMEVLGMSEVAVSAEIQEIDLEAVKATQYEEADESKQIELQIFDFAVSELEKGGKTLKYKDKLRKKLENGG